MNNDREEIRRKLAMVSSSSSSSSILNTESGGMNGNDSNCGAPVISDYFRKSNFSKQHLLGFSWFLVSSFCVKYLKFISINSFLQVKIFKYVSLMSLVTTRQQPTIRQLLSPLITIILFIITTTTKTMMRRISITIKIIITTNTTVMVIRPKMVAAVASHQLWCPIFAQFLRPSTPTRAKARLKMFYPSYK